MRNNNSMKGRTGMNIEDIIKYKFKNKELLDIAITHSSYAHENDIEYYKANLLVPRDNGKEDIINLKFKKF